jgi:phosphoribosyl 1,2-cyclic phosphate phosphodiesterase
VLNALRKQHHISHFTLAEAIEVVQEIKIPKSIFHAYFSSAWYKHEEIEAELPDGIHLAYDGLMLEFS